MDGNELRSQFLKIITDGLKEALRPGSVPEDKRAAVFVARSSLRRGLFTMEELETTEEELSSLERVILN